MLTLRELVTLRAALLFWKEEMCPHSEQVMQPYFDGPAVKPLSAIEVDQLQAQLEPPLVRYAQLDRVNQKLVDGQLFTTPADVSHSWGAHAQVATVLLPHE